ncbi:hypothetical protein HQ535_00995 [bacterium]|nr:hypothetical protein [bacterium]
MTTLPRLVPALLLVLIVAWGGYLMFYDGHADDSGDDASRAIGAARSTDGFTWEPIGIVLEADEGDWSATGVYDPNVERTADGFLMAHWASRPNPDRGRSDELLGLASSPDGLLWDREPQPVMSSTSYGIADVLISSTVFTDETLFVYFDALVAAWSSTIWTAALAPE